MMSFQKEKVLIIVGNIVHCTEPFSVHTLEKGFVVVRGSKIVAIDHAVALDETKEALGISNVQEVVLKDSQILIPGLIDAHIHAPQYPNAGLGYDKPLLEWLQKYTFPLESKYRDREFARGVYEVVVQRTLFHGTTTACYFGSLYSDSTLDLADFAILYGQRAFIGKVNMTKSAHYNYVETDEEMVQETRRFVTDLIGKKSPLVKPIITPRFALSLNGKTMKELAEIAKEFDLHIQSHISENKDEVALVNKEYGESYAKAYDDAGLLTKKTVLAHGVYLEESEMRLLAERGTSIAHCPESNTNLQSGLCDVRNLVRHGIAVGLGSDVSGGASPSIVSAMRAAIQTSIHLSYSKQNYDPLNCYDVFYLATLGGAKALALDDVVGNFQVGKDFDALIVDMDVENGGVDYLHVCTPIELIQKFIYVGDDRNIVKVYVAGKCVKSLD